jgi:hypothetical protein
VKLKEKTIVEKKDPGYIKQLIFTLNETIERWNLLKTIYDYTPLDKEDKKINT